MDSEHTKEIKAIIRPAMLDRVLDALHVHADLPGVTVSEVSGFGKMHGTGDPDESGSYGRDEWVKLEIVVSDEALDLVHDTVVNHARTGKTGDGVVYVISVEAATKIRTGRDASGEGS